MLTYFHGVAEGQLYLLLFDRLSKSGRQCGMAVECRCIYRAKLIKHRVCMYPVCVSEPARQWYIAVLYCYHVDSVSCLVAAAVADSRL